MSQAPPAQFQALETLHADIAFVILGLYGWEYVQSFNIERDVICGRSSFRVPLVPYVVGRVSLLCYFLLTAIQSSPFPTPESMCEPVTLFNALFAVITLGCASTNFMIRTWVIWQDSRVVHALQVILALVQWTLLVFDVAATKLGYVEGGCELILKFPKLSSASVIYTMCLDFIILVLSVLGLARQKSASPLTMRLRTQGIIYFAIAWIVYIPPAVLAMVNNFQDIPLLEIFANIALTTSTIVASRAVRSLLSLKTCTSSEPGESNVALTTEIVVGTSMT